MADNPAVPPAVAETPKPSVGPGVAPGAEGPRARRQDGPRGGHELELRRAMDDAECLLHYASQAGIDISEDVMTDILAAREAFEQGRLGSAETVAFLSAYAKLAARLAPVTAETVRASNERLGAVVRGHGALAICTTVLIVALSLLIFVTTSIGNDIGDGLTRTNELAAKARAHVGAPAIGNVADETCGEATALPNPPIVFEPPMNELIMITELQSLAASIRDLHTSAIKLNRFVLSVEHNPFDAPDPSKPLVTPGGNPYEALQLPPSLSNFRAAAMCKIAAYQQVRSFAQNVKADAVLAYGSLAAYVLPVLFALLGAFAFNLRDYTSRVKARTYHPSYVNSARIIVAVICGAIISFFNGFTQGLNLLAAAFLVGYGVEIFFTFLDSLLVSFGAKKPGPAPDAGTR